MRFGLWQDTSNQAHVKLFTRT